MKLETPTILIIDDVDEMLVLGLKANGFEVNYLPNATVNEILNLIPNADGLIVRTKIKIDQVIFDAAKKLKFIARAGAGTDNIDMQIANEKNIVVLNAGEANSDAVGEQTLAMLLGLFTKTVKANNEVKKFIWDREGNRGIELAGKTVGIIGYGNTGKAVAKKLSGFGVNVLAYDKYLTDYTDAYAIESTMADVFEKADVLTLHVPLTNETEQMVDLNYLNQFKKNIWVLNLSRGKVLNTPEFVLALKSGKVIGAGLDVLENEKINSLSDMENKWFDFFLQSPNVILTPHVGGWTNESYRKISEVLLKKILHLKFNLSVS